MGRFAVSAYSRGQDPITIHNEEILLDKSIGLPFIKTSVNDGGDIISFDNLASRRRAVQLMQQYAIVNSLKGDILDIDLELGEQYPTVLEEDDLSINLLSEPISLSNLTDGESKNILLFIELIDVALNGDGGKLANPSTIEYTLKHAGVDSVDVSTVIQAKADGPTAVIDLVDYNEANNVRLTSIVVKVDPNLPTTGSDGSILKYRHILTNFLIFVEKEGI